MKLSLMSRRLSLSLAVALLIVGAAVAIVPRRTSNTVQAQVGFSNFNFRGTYTLSQLFQGGSGGAFAILNLDGRGNLAGTNTAANVPGPPDPTGRGTRIVFPPFPLTGTYSVNANGSGIDDSCPASRWDDAEE